MKRSSNVPLFTPQARARRHETWNSLYATERRIARIWLAAMLALLILSVVLPLVMMQIAVHP